MDSDEEMPEDNVNDEEFELQDTDSSIEIEPVNLEEQKSVVYHFEVLTTKEIVQHMADYVKEVNAVVHMPETTTRMLLNHFKWDKEKLMERLYDGDQEKLFTETHLVNPFRKGIATTKSSTSQVFLPNTRLQYCRLECGVCFSALSDGKMTGLECGHRFCFSCWDQYLTSKIMDEGIGPTISCIEHKCDILVDHETVTELVKDPKVKLKYQLLITNEFVQCNRLLRWCSSPGCNNAIKVQYVEEMPVTCKCGRVSCFSCGNDWHEPLQCELLRQWMKKCDDDSETLHWIASKTKECAKCKASIEKNGGCNHMICRNQNCGFEFCWHCLGRWDVHGSNGYSCNSYNDAQRQNKSKSRAALERYLFYCNRYQSHKDSLKLENELYKKVAEKMKVLQEENVTWIEVQFLKKAVDILCSCRQVLMYTYVFAFYLKNNNQSQIFQDNQKDLENATECLSAYLERDLTAAVIADIKQMVQDKSRYCGSRRKVLVEHVYEGYEKELWRYKN